MFSRGFSLVICCALCASPALALDVYEDLTLTAANYPAQAVVNVYGSAVLTIDGANPTQAINLYDSSSLVMASGITWDPVFLRGENAITVHGGNIREGIKSYSPASSISIFGGAVGPLIQQYQSNATMDVFALVDVADPPNQIIHMENAMFSTTNIHYIAEQPFYRTREDRLVIGGSGSGGSTTIQIGHGPNFRTVNWRVDPATPIPTGDADRNGVVDLADLNLVRNHFGQVFPVEMAGDTFPLDGVVDLDDLNRVRNHFGATNPVPEPSTLAIAGLGCVLLAGIPSWRRRPPSCSALSL